MGSRCSKKNKGAKPKVPMGDGAGHGRVLGGPHGGRVSGVLRAGFGPHEPLFPSAGSESA
eukprot:6676895-Alexandrium_andersonii.AAC.1